ncbi:hypothetical protein AC249_AIPGENE8013 [Exaiptasia diaphana]|nr:hypothetical protein AC249_AIPGENE8013 [Exaiptasia diaphana]
MSPRLDPRPWISLKRNSFNFTFKNLFFLVVFLPIRLLLACDKDYVIPGHALVNHVSASFVGVTNYQDCVERCTANSACYSINYYNTGAYVRKQFVETQQQVALYQSDCTTTTTTTTTTTGAGCSKLN